MLILVLINVSPTGFLLATLFICSKCGVISNQQLKYATHLNIKCGGDSCARGILLGALYGAQVDFAIPDGWWDKVDQQVLVDVGDLCLQLSAANDSHVLAHADSLMN